MVKLLDAFPQILKDKVTPYSKSKDSRSFKQKHKNTKTKPKVEYAFERLKKLPLESDRNVKSAMNHFFNVKGVTDEERHEGFKKIVNKANYFKICTMAYTEKYDKYYSSINSKESKDN